MLLPLHLSYQYWPKHLCKSSWYLEKEANLTYETYETYADPVLDHVFRHALRQIHLAAVVSTYDLFDNSFNKQLICYRHFIYTSVGIVRLESFVTTEPTKKTVPFLVAEGILVLAAVVITYLLSYIYYNYTLHQNVNYR